MTVPDLLAALAAEGVELSATDAGKVRYSRTPSSRLLESLVAMKPQVLAHLRAGAYQPGPCAEADEYESGGGPWIYPSAFEMDGARRVVVHISFEYAGLAWSVALVPDDYPDDEHEGVPAMSRSRAAIALEAGTLLADVVALPRRIRVPDGTSADAAFDLVAAEIAKLRSLPAPAETGRPAMAARARAAAVALPDARGALTDPLQAQNETEPRQTSSDDFRAFLDAEPNFFAPVPTPTPAPPRATALNGLPLTPSTRNVDAFLGSQAVAVIADGESF